MATETPSASEHVSNGQRITEDEASLYDRQIRLWGIEAQNRMRSSTVLVISLRSIAHETIKNLVLAGIGRLIVMDGQEVTEEDLGGGFLFREEDGAVGKERTEAALPQIASLNPLVSLSAFPTMSPFIGGEEADMVTFLKSEKVDVVVACDLTRTQIEAIDAAAHKAGTMFYAAGTYSYYGYVITDLGDSYDFVATPPPTASSSALVKKRLAFPRIMSAFDRKNWSLSSSETAKGGSPFRGVSRNQTRQIAPQLSIAILALWEFETRQGSLPTGGECHRKELVQIAEDLRETLGVNEKAVSSIETSLMEHLSSHAAHFFPPTLAILGGLLAQDVLRSLSRKEQPVANLLVLDSLGSVASASTWAMGPAVET